MNDGFGIVEVVLGGVWLVIGFLIAIDVAPVPSRVMVALAYLTGALFLLAAGLERLQ